MDSLIDAVIIVLFFGVIGPGAGLLLGFFLKKATEARPGPVVKKRKWYIAIVSFLRLEDRD